MNKTFIIVLLLSHLAIARCRDIRQMPNYASILGHFPHCFAQIAVNCRVLGHLDFVSVATVAKCPIMQAYRSTLLVISRILPTYSFYIVSPWFATFIYYIGKTVQIDSVKRSKIVVKIGSNYYCRFRGCILVILPPLFRVLGGASLKSRGCKF